MRRRDILDRAACACLMPLASACRRSSGGFPSQPIRLLVPFSVGSGTDREARDILPYLRRRLRVPVVVENEPGADGSMGMARIARATPDCYLLAYFGVPSLILTELGSGGRYRVRDLSHIFAWIRENLLLLVRPDKWRTFESFLAEGRRRRLTAAVPSLNSTGRLAGLLLARETGIEFGWIPFGGSNTALAAVLGGHVDCCAAVTASCLPLIRSGRLKPMLVFADERDAACPEAPTPAELGFSVPGLPILRGVVAPPAAPAERLRILEEAFRGAVSDPGFVVQAKRAERPLFPLSAAEYRREVESCYRTIESLPDLTTPA